MRVHGKTILKHNSNYEYMVRYSNFCGNKLEKAGYILGGYDFQTNEVTIFKYKNPDRTWDSTGREIYHFDSYIDAAEKLIGVTQDDFEKQITEN